MSTPPADNHRRRKNGRDEKGPSEGGAEDSGAGTVSPSSRPTGVLVISAILVLEGLGLLAVGVWLIVGLIVATPSSYSSAVFLVVLVLLLAAGLLTVGHFLFRGYRRSRSPALVWQLFMIVMAITTMTSGPIVIGLIMLAAALIVLVLLFTKAVFDYTSRTGSDQTVL